MSSVKNIACKNATTITHVPAANSFVAAAYVAYATATLAAAANLLVLFLLFRHGSLLLNVIEYDECFVFRWLFPFLIPFLIFLFPFVVVVVVV